LLFWHFSGCSCDYISGSGACVAPLSAFLPAFLAVFLDACLAPFLAALMSAILAALLAAFWAQFICICGIPTP